MSLVFYTGHKFLGILFLIDDFERASCGLHLQVGLLGTGRSLLKAMKKPVIPMILFGVLLVCYVKKLAMIVVGGGGVLVTGRFMALDFTFVCLMSLVVFTWLVFHQVSKDIDDLERNNNVLKLQVGLLGTGRSLQRDLDRSDTSSVLRETTLALLFSPDYCISGYSSVYMKRRGKDTGKENFWEDCFNRLLIEDQGKLVTQKMRKEEGKFDEDLTIQKASGLDNEYVVITILAAANGTYELPLINGSGDLKEALKTLTAIPTTVAADEVIWTPTLSERELLEDYPLLRPL